MRARTFGWPREQIEENRTSSGSLSWLSKQTRPDLQFAVSQAQKKQNAPTVADLKYTKALLLRAFPSEDRGERKPVNAYHDAACGNTLLDDATVPQDGWIGDHQVASQLGALNVPS